MSIPVPLVHVDDNPYQTRQRYDADRVVDLAASIARDGLIQPPVGRLVDPEGEPQSWKALTLGSGEELRKLLGRGYRVQLAVGHSRARAYRHLFQEQKSAAYVSMPVEVRDLTDDQMEAMAWAENHERKDLDPIEEAAAIRARIERHGWTHAQAGEALGLSRPAISNKLRLLKLPGDVQACVIAGDISEAQARALVPMYDCIANHEALVDELAGFQIENPEYILRQARSGSAAEMVQFYVKRLVDNVEGEAARRERAQKPELFEEDALSEDAPTEETEELVDWNGRPLTLPGIASAVTYGRITSSDVVAIYFPKDHPAPPADSAGNYRLATAGTCSYGHPGFEQGHGLVEQVRWMDTGERTRVGPDVTVYTWNRHPLDVLRLREAVAERAAGEPMWFGSWPKLAHFLKGFEPEADDAEEAVPTPPTRPKSIAETLALPKPVLDEPQLWDETPRWPEGHEKAGKVLTIADLERLQKRYKLGMPRRYGHDPYAGSHKADHVIKAQRYVQYCANYRCAYALDGRQLSRFMDWCDTEIAPLDRFQTRDFRYRGDHDARTAAHVLRELSDVDEAAVFDGHEQEDEWRRLAEAEHRRAAVFCYHLFCAEMAQPIGADVSAETTPAVVEADEVPA